MFQVALTGLLTGLALIVAVGAQNAFLLRQAIRGEHVLPIVLTCLVSDVIAITAGVAGLGVVLERWPAVLPVAERNTSSDNVLLPPLRVTRIKPVA